MKTLPGSLDVLARIVGPDDGVSNIYRVRILQFQQDPELLTVSLLLLLKEAKGCPPIFFQLVDLLQLHGISDSQMFQDPLWRDQETACATTATVLSAARC